MASLVAVAVVASVVVAVAVADLGVVVVVAVASVTAVAVEVVDEAASAIVAVEEGVEAPPTVAASATFLERRSPSRASSLNPFDLGLFSWLVHQTPNLTASVTDVTVVRSAYRSGRIARVYLGGELWCRERFVPLPFSSSSRGVSNVSTFLYYRILASKSIKSNCTPEYYVARVMMRDCLQAQRGVSG